MSETGRESAESFLQQASDNLQFLREYSGELQDARPGANVLERLYAAAHTLATIANLHSYPLFSEVASKMAHIFQYALHAGLGPDIHGPITEFLSDAIAVLEFNLLRISSDGHETVEDIVAFKQRYAFAFPQPTSSEPPAEPAPRADVGAAEPIPGVFSTSWFRQLPEDGDVPEEVLEFFLPEAEEHLQAVTECLLELEAKPSPEAIHRLFRSVHTVKGSAAQVGLRRISAIAHRVEDLIGFVRDGVVDFNQDIADVGLEAVDVLKKFLHRQWTDAAAMRSACESLLGRLAELAPEASREEAEEAAAEGGAARSPGRAVAASPATSRPLHPTRSVRVSLERLDRMMNVVGELVINRTRMLGRLAELRKLIDVLGFSKERLSGKIAEFQEKYEFSFINPYRVSPPSPASAATEPNGPRKRATAKAPGWAEFTELEMDRYDDFNILARSLAEISADVNEVLSQLGGFMGRAEADVDEFTKLAHQLEDEITQARMVPIGNLYTRLSRTVRDAAKDAGKQVGLVLEGAETELDNNIIQQVSDPLIHLVRNAVAHGLESPAERRQAGKPPGGKVTVRAYHRGNHIYVEVEDDGRGIGLEQVRARAIESGWVSAEEAPRLSEQALTEMLFRPGFSTSAQMTELAGRGVGLDVVRANITALNGETEVRTQAGQGTCFTLKVPLTLIISPALFVRCGTSLFALPLALVEEIRRVRPEEIEELGGELITRVRDAVLQVLRLDVQLALQPIEPVNGFFHMVIVNVAGRQVGVVVEEVQGKDEIVIKNLGEYLRKVRLFPGTTIAADGSLILLIDLNRLAAPELMQRRTLLPSASAARVFAPGAAAVAAGSIPVEAIDTLTAEKVVVVADDSISVRKFVGRMLEKAGYRVRLASDGLEAAEAVAQSGCHLIITDLEMPRMNGYELMAHLRQDPAMRRIPVMVVTSRAGAKHRDRAMKEGAVAFLTKPVQEEQLVTAVAEIIGPARAPLTPAPATVAQ